MLPQTPDNPRTDPALAQDISRQKSIPAAIIAAQLSIKFGAGDRQVIKTLTKMTNDPKSPDMLLHTRATLVLLEDEESRNSNRILAVLHGMAVFNQNQTGYGLPRLCSFTLSDPALCSCRQASFGAKTKQ